MKIICIGRNYADHAAEMNSPVPSQPMVFMKPPSALLVNNKPFYYPDFTQNLHYEGELVIKICKNGKHVDAQFASDYYDEMAFGFDLTARDLQARCKEKGHPWEIAKGFDGSAVLSPFIPMPSKTAPIEITTKLNNEVVQQGSTADLIFGFDALIVHVSKYFKLQMGDIIYTGTPAGVGPLQIGDMLEGYIGAQKMIECEIK